MASRREREPPARLRGVDPRDHRRVELGRTGHRAGLDCRVVLRRSRPQDRRPDGSDRRRRRRCCPTGTVAKQIEGLPAHDVWIVMASCFSGGFTELMAPGRILTAAADANSLGLRERGVRSFVPRREYLIHQALLEGASDRPRNRRSPTRRRGSNVTTPIEPYTQIDQSTEAISLDGVHRATPTLGPGSSGGSGSPGGEARRPPCRRPPRPARPPPPCHNLLVSSARPARDSAAVTCSSPRLRMWRPGPVQLRTVNRVRAGRQQLSADPRGVPQIAWPPRARRGHVTGGMRERPNRHA